jgi:hypothetical protein
MTNKRSHDSADSTMTRIRARRSEVRIPVGVGDLSLLKNIQIGSGAHPASYSKSAEGSFSASKATPHLGPRLRESVTLSPLALHAVMALVGTALPLPLPLLRTDKTAYTVI